MPSLGSVLLFVLGLLFLTGGAEVLVRGAASLARRLGVAPVVVGLTVVALGTSAPELAVSVDAVLSGSGGISVGNVVGSNIFNILSILGISAVAAPLAVSARLVRFDVPVMIGASLLLVLLALDGRIGRVDGGLLFLLGVTYLALLLTRRSAPAGPVDQGAPGDEPGDPVEVSAKRWTPVLADIGLVVAGLALLVLGSHWLVGSAVAFARALGVSQMVVGLTLVAGGTSLPELATSLVAALRGERELAVGNVVGSNVANLFLVLGPTAVISGAGLRVPAQALSFDLPVMTAAALFCLPIFFTGYRISRWEGAVLFGYYLAYVTFLILDATGRASVRILEPALLWFALPLTALMLIALGFDQLRRTSTSRS